MATRRIRTPGRTVVVIILIAFAVIMFVPMVWFVLSAFKTRTDIVSVPLQLIPREWTVVGFQRVWTETQLPRAYLNSVGLALATLLSVLFTSSLGGYVFARLKFPGRRGIFYFVLATSMVPFVTMLIPLYLVMSKLGLVDTYAAVWLPTAVSSFGIFLCRQYVSTLPAELYEAAKLDGAGDWRIYWLIVLPLIKPVLAVIAIFSMVFSFNDYLWPLVVLDNQDLYTLPLELAQASKALGVTSYETVIAGALLASVPGLIIFLTLHRHVLKGLVIGSVRG
jgi:multiple sugar transport system permease protein